MGRQILLLFLANAAHIVSGSCRRSLLEPNVTVGDSRHLLVNWEKAFEGCDSSQVQSATIEIYPTTIQEVAFAEKEAKVEANPCLTHPFVIVKLQWEERSIYSHVSRYNDYNVYPKIEELYSGLLQKQVVDKICLQNNGTLFVPQIPDGVSKCAVSYGKERKYSGSTSSTQFVFKIVDPQNEKGTRVVKTGLKIDEHCTLSRSKDIQEDEHLDQGQTMIIISCSIVGTLLSVILVAAAIWRCSKRFKAKKMIKIDINPIYDAADVDYEEWTTSTSKDYDYDTMDINEASIRRKDMKMKAVDENSVNGKPDEG